MKQVILKAYLWITGIALALYFGYAALQFGVDYFGIGEWRKGSDAILGIETYITVNGVDCTLSVGEIVNGMPAYKGITVYVRDSKDFRIGDKINYFYFSRRLQGDWPSGYILDNPAQIPKWAGGIEAEIKNIKN